MLMLNECGPIQGLIFRGGSGSFTGVFACGGLIVSSQSDELLASGSLTLRVTFQKVTRTPNTGANPGDLFDSQHRLVVRGPRIKPRQQFPRLG